MTMTMTTTKRVIGIDFGTTNSCVSYYCVKKKKVILIENNDGEYTSPSFLFFDPDSDEILFGKAAKNLFNKNTNYTPNIFNNLKRLIGKSCNDLINDKDLYQFFKHNKLVDVDVGVDDSTPIKFNVKYNKRDVIFNVEELITIYIRYLVQIVYNKLNEFENGVDVVNVVITIPAYFNDIQRESLKNVCTNLNLNVIRIINEPTSAALAYGYKCDKLEKEKESNYVLVFDCGGGTTDLTLLYMDYEENVYQVKNVIGDNFLGGEDLTMYLVEYVKGKLISEGVNITDKIMNKLSTLCEKAKKDLSFKENTEIIVEIGDILRKYDISRVKFQNICKEFFKKIEKLIKFINIKECTDVIFVGGTTRIPYIETLFSCQDFKINKSLDPDQTISIGASIDGALLCNLFDDTTSFKDAFLLDVVPLSLGIEIEGGMMSTVIPRNSILPVSKTKEFTNSKSYEEEIVINIYQGERAFVKDNLYLVSFTIKNDLLKNSLKNTVKIKVVFNVNNDGIITATACINDKVDDKSKSSVIVTKAHNKNCKGDVDLESLLESEVYKLVDSETTNKTILKLELYDSFKYLLSIFKDRINTYDEFKKILFNKLFNDTFNVIINYTEFSVKELKDTKVSFEKEWHILGLYFDDVTINVGDVGGTDIN